MVIYMKLSKTKRKRRNNIIQHGQDLIIEKGFNKLNVTEVCEKAQIGRKTFYNYFDNKIDLAVEIALNLNGEVDLYSISVDNEKSGLEQLREYFSQLTKVLIDHTDILVLMTEFDGLLGEMHFLLGCKDLDELKKTEAYRIIKTGIEDHSIDAMGLEIEQLITILFEPFIGGLQKFASKGKSYTEFFNSSINDMEKLIDIIIKGVAMK